MSYTAHKFQGRFTVDKGLIQDVRPYSPALMMSPNGELIFTSPLNDRSAQIALGGFSTLIRFVTPHRVRPNVFRVTGIESS